MAKVARGALKVINVVATVVAVVTAGSPVSAIASAVAVASNVALQITAKKPRSPGTANDFRFDPNSGIPYAFGRTFVGGNVVHTDAYAKDNQLQSYVVVWSGGGPIEAIESILVDRVVTTFSGFNAVGYYHDWMYLRTQLGSTPEGAALASPVLGGASLPDWGAASKLSGYAAGLWTIKFDKKQKKYTAGAPEFGAVVQGAKVYDPRLDSTYPGGSGPCRALNEATYVYSEYGPLHALTFALGRWQNGKKVIGAGIPVNQIDVASFVEAANIAEANGWKISGTCYSTDDKWNTLKLMLQTCAAEPKKLGARLSCLISAPRVSLATITGKDLADGELSVPGMQGRRARINTVVPRYLSEAHGWEIIPAAPVSVAAYVTEDGGRRSRETEIPYCPGLDQAAELAAYEIVNAREFGPIVLPLKTRWIGYIPGDCLTIDIPELGLNSQRVIVIKRALDPASGAVSMQFKSETDAKHAFALGQTGTAPPSPTLGLPILDVAQPEAGAWAAIGTTFSDNGVEIPAIVVTGAADNGTAEAVIFEFRVAGVTGWTNHSTEDAEVTRCEISGLTPGTDYDVAVSYRLRGVVGARLILGPVTAGNFTIPGSVGDPGADGEHGLSVAELTIYKRAAAAPATPTGGSYDFSTLTLTPPSGWTTALQDGPEPAYVAKATAAVTGTGGTDSSLSWTTPARAFSDGQAVDLIFKRSATQPSTPGPSAGAPATWYSLTADVPAGADPIWVSFGERPAPGESFVWQTPKRAEGVDGDTGAPGATGGTGATGTTGAPGNKTVRAYKRAASVPATPSGDNVPSGWSATIPADDGTAVWASDAEVQSNGATLVGAWTTPQLWQATTPTIASQTVPLVDDGTSSSILVALPNGGTVTPEARYRQGFPGSTTGSGTATLKIEWRELGGTFATLGTTASQSFGPGEVITLSRGGNAVTNSSGFDKIYEFRGVTTLGAGGGDFDESRSFLKA